MRPRPLAGSMHIMGGQHAVVFAAQAEGLGAALHPPVRPEGFEQLEQQVRLRICQQRQAQAGGQAARLGDEGVLHRSPVAAAEHHRGVLDAGGDGRQGIFDKGFVIGKLTLDRTRAGRS